jgi:multiple antibiotic resistance protein
MEHWTEYTRFVVALLAILDPFLAIPMFLTLTSDATDAYRHRTARAVTLTVLIVLIVAAVAGETILRLFGASLSSFRVGGGLVLLAMAFAMLNARTGALRQTPEEARELESQNTMGIVPLAIPLLAGPGAISMVIIAVEGRSLLHQATIVACVVGVCLIVWGTLHLAVPIGRLISTTGRNIATRLLGLLLAAISIEMIAQGLKRLFPALGAG